MSDSEEPNQPKENLKSWSARTKSLPKNKVGLFAPDESLLHENLDKNCLYKFDNTLVRIEYPGLVKNVDKAIESLGGIEEIQNALEQKKLELLFHPKSQYMKGCVADLDQVVGILVKVTQKTGSEELSYEIVGASDTCFKFNRMCDFQYLPLLSKDKPETKESEVDYMYDKVILDKIPKLEWFTKKEPSGNSLFLVSGNFARFDQPHGRFQSNSSDAFNSMVRNNAPQLPDFSKRKMKEKVYVPSLRVSLFKHVEVPQAPLAEALENMKTEFLQVQLKLAKELFEERPIWTKPGVMHKINMQLDTAKHVLPCVAYYCHGGPWRACWIKFGYNPVTDYNSRIYQVLDFRIRHTEGMQIQVKTKRTSCNIARGFITKKADNSNSDINYIIRPNQIPPARQMFYQYCDILIPEIQEMIMKLPKLPSTAKFDPKNGWLPLSFQEHCREIVNRYIFDAVQQELLKGAQEQRAAEKSEDVATYCSKMLNNIKKGFSQSIGEYSGTSSQENIIDEIDLSDDDDEQIDANEVMNSLPERLPETLNDEEGDEDSDLEIDMEIVEEVNQIVAGVKDQTL